MNSRSLTSWLRGQARRDALLAAWHTAPHRPTTAYEADALTVAALGGKTGTPVTVAIPGGHARLPLLAAVHAAALRLPGYPSPFSGRPHGPAALVTRQTVRRQELAALDAAGVSISPALQPARLRADQQVAPLSGRHPRPQSPFHLLLVVSPAANWVIPTLPPSTVIVDAASGPEEWIRDAVAWSTACRATAIVFVDIARPHTWPQETVLHPCGWSAILASESSNGDLLGDLAPIRGRAAVFAAGAQPDLAATAALLADARRRAPIPPILVEASVLWRRLDELVTPQASYDAACPRWHTRTLSERLDDIAAVRTSEFPDGWHTWAETCWAAVKNGLISARDALKTDNTKAALLVDLVDADLRAERSVDIALPSRIARDALTRHLDEAGVPMPADGRLVVRSLSDAQAWTPPRATVLAAPPAVAQRHRLVSGDIGPLNVLCYDHEITPLRRILEAALDEPQSAVGRIENLLPPALEVSVDLPSRQPSVLLAVTGESTGRASQQRVSLLHFADAIEITGLAALTTEESALADLPDDDSGTVDLTTGRGGDRSSPDQLVAAVVLTVAADDSGRQLRVPIPAHATILRIVGGNIHRLPIVDTEPGMLVTALDGVTPFERLRPLLLEARGPVARMLLTAWNQAIETALDRTGGPTQLARALATEGGDVTSNAIAEWLDEERIGPREPANLARVGRLGGHPVVADNSPAIAAVMRDLRILHQAVGRVVANPFDLDGDAADELEELLGPDAASIVAETVIYRVHAVSPVTTVARHELYHAQPATNTREP